MLWPQAMAGVVGYARHPTTPCWPLPREGFPSLHPLLIQGGDFSQPVFYLCRSVLARERKHPGALGGVSLMDCWACYSRDIPSATSFACCKLKV
jgi:hypothetical protein